MWHYKGILEIKWNNRITEKTENTEGESEKENRSDIIVNTFIPVELLGG